jgi:putative endonuclease
MRFGFVYIMASGKRCTLYIGVTSDIGARVAEHKRGAEPDSFTARYGCDCLVYYERFDLITEAIAREKQLKHWKRQWKIELIEAGNPDWNDLTIGWENYER